MKVLVVATTVGDLTTNSNGRTDSFSFSCTGSATGDANDITNVVNQAISESQLKAFMLKHEILIQNKFSKLTNNYFNTDGNQSSLQTTTVQTFSE
jgi:hypothetical protein